MAKIRGRKNIRNRPKRRLPPDTKISAAASVMTNLPQVLINMIVEGDAKQNYMSYEPVANAIKKAEQELGTNGRIFVRASGTEPLLRIMLEGPDDAVIARLGLDVASAMTECFGARRR